MTPRRRHQIEAAVIALLLAAFGYGVAYTPADTPTTETGTWTVTTTAPLPAVSPSPTSTPAASAGGNLTIWFLDVGQGDSELIEMPNGCTWLIDAGPAGSAASLVSQLRGDEVTQINAWTLTHDHADHYGGYSRVRSAFGVGTAAPETLDPSVLVEAVPHDRDQTPDENDKSLVYRVSFGHAAVLFTGDASAAVEDEEIDEGAGRLRADVVKVPHHGSSSSSSAAFLSAVRPSLAVIEVGLGNDYGHPTVATLQHLSKAGAKILRTDRDGWIEATTDGSTWTVRTENGNRYSFIASAK